MSWLEKLENGELPLKSNDIGSLPLKYNMENFELALKIKVEAGLDFITFPQFADWDMIAMYLDPLVKQECGIEKKGEAYYYDVSSFSKPKSIDTTFLKSARTLIARGRTIKRPDLVDKIRVPLTGPITLTYSTHNVEKGELTLAFDESSFLVFSEIIYEEILDAYIRMKPPIITIDEPLLGAFQMPIIGQYELGRIGRSPLIEQYLIVLEKILDKIKSKGIIPSIHTCADLSPDLLEFLFDLPSLRLLFLENYEIDPEERARRLEIVKTALKESENAEKITMGVGMVNTKVNRNTIDPLIISAKEEEERTGKDLAEIILEKALKNPAIIDKQEEINALAKKYKEILTPSRMWCNPNCGTGGWFLLFKEALLETGVGKSVEKAEEIAKKVGLEITKIKLKQLITAQKTITT